jgi:membrane protein
MRQSATHENAADSRGAPEAPTDLPKKSWPAIVKRTFKQFSDDKLTRWAAALTYFSVLSLFPMLLALISVLGLIGQSATGPLLSNVESLAPGPAREILISVLNNLQSSGGSSTVAFVVALAAAIWAASSYIAAFMDASNVVWDAPEGRPFWKKIPIRLGITVVLLILLTATGLAVVFTGPLAQRLGDVVGVGGAALTIWDIGKWPLLVLIVSFMISLLFWAAPNVKQPGFPWITPGGVLAVVLWLAASALFTLYVANFGSYNETYGSLGGVIVFLIWLWITNIVILLGAEFNAEMERARAIERGHPVDEEPYLPLRDEPED